MTNSRRYAHLLLLGMTVLCLIGHLAMLVHAGGSDATGLQLERVIARDTLTPGESTTVSFKLTNAGEREATYTLIEEIPEQLSVIDSPGGSYSAIAGLVIWRGTVSPGSSVIVEYEVAFKRGNVGDVWLNAYLSSTRGDSVESGASLRAVAIPFNLWLGSTLVPLGEDTIVYFRVENPFDEPLHLRLETVKTDGLQIDPPIPSHLHLGPAEMWEFQSNITAERAGMYSLRIEPRGPSDQVVQGESERTSQTVTLEVFGAGGVGSQASAFRPDVAITSPEPDQVFIGQEQINVQIEAALGAEITFQVNGEEIADHKIGEVVLDYDRQRFAQKYIAIPLIPGKNILTAQSIPPTGRSAEHEIVVYRSGPVADLHFVPQSALVTGSVEPIVVDILATDSLGFSPPDGAAVTVDVQGGRILTRDAQPDWVGHQLLFKGGRAELHVQSPAEPTELVIRARIGDVDVAETFQITARADSWFILGHATVRVDGVFNRKASEHLLSSGLRLFARGPVRDYVLTAAYDRGGFEKESVFATEWTGDYSTPGTSAADDGRVYARVERGFSYAQVGRGAVTLESTIAPYQHHHTGVQFRWRTSTPLDVKGFMTREPLERVEETFPGDGTGYFRVAEAPLQPMSEQISVVVRHRLAPHDVVQETVLPTHSYRIDYVTGQIMLARPLASMDEKGNRQEIKVRYTPEGSSVYDTVKGIQAAWDAGHVTWRASALEGFRHDGSRPRNIMVGGHAKLRGLDIDVEIARSRTMVGKANAYALDLGRTDSRRWDFRVGHRTIEDGFATVDGIEPKSTAGRLTFVEAEGTMGSFEVTTAARHERQDETTPATTEVLVGVHRIAGVIRPELALKASRKEGDLPDVFLIHGVLMQLGRGSLMIRNERNLETRLDTERLFEGTYRLWDRTALQWTYTYEAIGPGGKDGRRSLGWGIAHTMGGEGAQTTVRSGYEVAVDGMTRRALVSGASSQWILAENHRLALHVDQKNYILDHRSPEFGGGLSWSYAGERTDSLLRVDRSVSEKGTKSSVMWHGAVPIHDHVTLRGDVLWSVDPPNRRRSRLSLSAAYRGERGAVLSRVATEAIDGALDRTVSVETSTKAVFRVTGNVSFHTGHAARRTSEQAATSKWAAGLTWHRTPQLAWQLEGSRLEQPETNTSKIGASLAIARQITPEAWLSFGYAFEDHVGLDASGPNFSDGKNGFFISVDISFDEWSLWQALPAWE